MRCFVIVTELALSCLLASCDGVHVDKDAAHVEPDAMNVESNAFHAEMPVSAPVSTTVTVEKDGIFHLEAKKGAFCISNPSLTIAGTASFNGCPGMFVFNIPQGAIMSTVVFAPSFNMTTMPGSFVASCTVGEGAIKVGEMDKGAVGASVWVVVALSILSIVFFLLWILTKINRNQDPRVCSKEQDPITRALL